MSLPTAALAPAGAALQAGVAADPLATANLNTDVLAGNQFSSLLAPNVKSTKEVDDTQTVTPPGDAANTAPQALNSIAVPPLPMYIDQPIVQNLQKADGTQILGGDKNSTITNNKLPIFNPQLETASKHAVIASEYADKKLDAQISGKIPLHQLADDQAEQDPEFAKAVANIVNQADHKILKAANPVASQVAKLEPAATNDNQVGKPVIDNNQQQLATTKAAAETGITKITAKILGVKEEKIDVASDDSTSTNLAANLKDFDAQLKTKSFSDVKTAHQALMQTPAEQIQIKISQAMASGENSIKIHLHPVELGAVDVEMETDHEGNTKISITADKADTLALLKTDSHNLTKTLADAGIKSDNATMQFNLRGDSQGQQQREFGNNNSQQNNNNNSGQQMSNGITGYSRFTNLNEQTLTLSANKGLNILV